MSKPVDTNSSTTIAQAFGSDCVVVSHQPQSCRSRRSRRLQNPATNIVRSQPPFARSDWSSHRSSFRTQRDPNSYLLLDGHLRIEVLRDLGETEVECLVSTDDEAFTYNKRISRLSPVQEQRMIAKAIERNVPRDKIARALARVRTH